MSIIAIVENDMIKLPMHVPDGTLASITLSKEGSEMIPPSSSWPAGFFDEVRIADPSFERPPQGELPAAPTLDQ